MNSISAAHGKHRKEMSFLGLPEFSTTSSLIACESRVNSLQSGTMISVIYLERRY